MLKSGQKARLSVLALSVFILAGTAAPRATGNIVLSDFKGSWRIVLRGDTDCGFASMLASITMDTAGVGSGTLQIHGECGDSTLAGQTFTVSTLAKTGKGTATLTCGSSCAWNFEIQVAADRSKFNLADISPLDPGVLLEGVGILSSAAENIVIADLKGEWLTSSLGQYEGLCHGPGVWTFSAVSVLTMNATGTGTAIGTSHTECDDFDDEEDTITILSLNADGSGTATIGDGTEISIQMSRDRAMFNFVTLSPNPQLFIAGVAIRRSTGGHITKANLAGDWQVAIGGADHNGDCAVSARFRFTLNAKGVATNNAVAFHDECGGDGTLTGTFKVLTLDPDGSGTARFTCADDCELNFRIQVSPDRATFSLVDVSTPGEFFIGKAVHQ